MNKDQESTIRSTVERMLKLTGLDATIEGVEERERTVLVKLSSPEEGKLIGSRGDTLRALQHIAGVIVRKELGEGLYVTLDVGDYLERQEKRLRDVARQMADEVKASLAEKQLRPMNAAQRRIVHMELAEVDGIQTESVGSGSERRITIKPA